VIATLGFDPESRQKLLDKGAMNLLLHFEETAKASEGRSLHRAYQLAMWNLKGESGLPKTKVFSSSTNQRAHVMVSYSWKQKERMRQLASFLKKEGFSIWIDVEQMKGSALDKMAEAVENSSVIIVGVSASYKESQHCRTEAQYGYSLSKKLLFVKAEEPFTPTGWLGALLGSSIYYSPWSHPQGFESGAQEIGKVLQDLGVQLSSPSPAEKGLDTLSDLSSPLASLDPLPPSLMSRKKACEWTSEQVCRWLNDCNLKKLVDLFYSHQMTGKSLDELSKISSSPLFFEALTKIGVSEMGLILEFRKELVAVFDKVAPSIAPRNNQTRGNH